MQIGLYVFLMNYMSMGIGRHYIIRRYITTKLYIVLYGYVIEVIVKYCDNTCTSKTELDTQPVKNASNNDAYIYANIFCYELHAYGYRPA